MIFYVQPRKAFAMEMAQTWQKGAPATEIREDLSYVPHRVGVFYGVTPETKPIFDRCRSYIYIDNGYFSSGHRADGFFRVTKNKLQHSGIGAVPNPFRFDSHKIAIEDFPKDRSANDHILIIVQSEWWYLRHGYSGGLAQWVEETSKAVRRYSYRPIRIRLKPKAKLMRAPNTVLIGNAECEIKDTPLREDFKGCHALVTHSSNAAVEAVLAGVPVFCTGASAALTMGLSDLSRIEWPYYPSTHLRRHWAQVLSCNQWSMDEIKNGTCFRELLNEH